MVLLTGAGGLLGDAFCRLHAADHEIIAVCRHRLPGVPSQHEEYVDPLAPGRDLAENRARVHVIQADLTRPEEVDRVVELALARHGRIDLLVNNAAHQQHTPFGLIDGDVAVTDLERHLTTNVVAPLRLAVRVAQEFWRDRAAENRAANRNVVNMSSLAGSRVFALKGQGPYAASKAALDQLTRHMAAEFEAFGVRVNALAPNSFPAIVRTEAVVEAITALDRGRDRGRVLVLDEDDQPRT